MTQNQPTSWYQALASLRHPRVISMLFFGFSSGLPYLLVFSTLSAWMRDLGIERSTIGFFSWVGIMFSVKVIWAPVVDRSKLPLLTAWLGKRRGWLLLGQIGIAVGLAMLAYTDPRHSLEQFALLCVLVAFCSATQDICVDAYRVEAAEDELQASMAAAYIFGYRCALLVAGAGAFYIAAASSWFHAYLVMAGLMSVGILTTLLVAEPEILNSPMVQELEKQVQQQMQRFAALPKKLQKLLAWFLAAVVLPFVEFFRRNGKFAILLLLFISIYRLSDITMGVMANPFYLDMGFSKEQIANVAKIFGFTMTILGSGLGGVLVARYGLQRPLFWGAVMVLLTNLLFSWMADQPANLVYLAVVISADNLSAGLASVAFIAYLSSLTSKHYTATQYALFSSLMTLPGKYIGGYSGVVVDTIGYSDFFIYSSLLGLPAVLLSFYLLLADKKKAAEPAS